VSKRHLFTSESVTEGHPDKIADQISDAILDEVYRDDPFGRVAVETLVTTGLVIVAGEMTTSTYVDIPTVVRKTIEEIGYTRAKYGFDYETCGIVVSIDPQSPDIAQGVNHALEERTGMAEDDARLPGGGRPGHDVRVRLQRDQGADAPAHSPGAQAGPQAGGGEEGGDPALSASRRQVAGHGGIRG